MSDQEQYEITAPIHAIGAVQQVTEKFRKRELILHVDAASKWPQTVPMTFTGDRCDKLDDFGEGEIVTVTFNLRGREHKGRYYGENAAFKIVAVKQATKPRGAAKPAASDQPDDDIPFAVANIDAEPSSVSRVLRRPT